jgi:hypothetical protein
MVIRPAPRDQVPVGIIEVEEPLQLARRNLPVNRPYAATFTCTGTGGVSDVSHRGFELGELL